MKSMILLVGLLTLAGSAWGAELTSEQKQCLARMEEAKWALIELIPIMSESDIPVRYFRAFIRARQQFYEARACVERRSNVYIWAPHKGTQ